MSASTPHELNLATTIRPGLDILANEIIIALKKRTRFASNPEVYEPGLVKGQPELSLLDYELAVWERNHAELGRYTFALQDAFTDVSRVTQIIDREPPQSVLRVMPSGVGKQLISFYREWIGSECSAGSDPMTFGETVTTDVPALLAIMERVNLGKAVAESKFLELTDQFIDTGGEREAMLELIVRRDRESDVLKMAASLARHYELDETSTVNVFSFMIKTTIDIEVDYLRLRIAEHLARS